MKKRTILIGVVVLLICVIGGGLWYYFNPKEEVIEEYVPQEEITEEQLRQSMVSLYFYNTETQELANQSKLIDVKELLENPYKTLVNLLMEAPKNEKLESILPEGTIVNKAELEGKMVVVDFSKEFIENHEVEKEKMILQALVQTLTQLTEVNAVRITIDGEENQKFSEEGISFETTFTLENII